MEKTHKPSKKKNKKIRIHNISPTSYLRDNLAKDINYNSRKKQKISDDDFEIPKFHEFEHLLKFNYKIPQLREICAGYKLKKSGNKDELIKRTYTYLKMSHKVIIIQKIWRGNLQRKYNDLHGPAFIKRNLCVNETDFYTLDDIKDIPYNQFFSFKDTDNFIYGCNILSLHNLFLQNKKRSENVKNPYNRQNFPSNIKKNLKTLIRLSRIVDKKIMLKIKDTHDKDHEKQLDMRIVSAFHKIDSLGNYSNIQWFNDLDRHGLIKFIRELIDIWEYRLQLSQILKREICPPIGDLFLSLNVGVLPSQSQEELRKTCITYIERLINSGINTDRQSLGAAYVLTALTLVSESAREALPWLYDSVAPVNNNL